MREGISVGYGDDYSGFLEGQDLPLDGLPDGRYVLVHRVNANEKLREISYANNAASVLLDLRWENGQPQLHALLRRVPTPTGVTTHPPAGADSRSPSRRRRRRARALPIAGYGLMRPRSRANRTSSTRDVTPSLGKTW